MSKLKVPQKPLKREINKKNTIDIQPVGIRYQRCFHLQKTIKKISIREKNCKKKNLNYAFACRGSRLAETVGFEPTSLRGIMISNVRQFWEKRVRGWSILFGSPKPIFEKRKARFRTFQNDMYPGFFVFIAVLCESPSEFSRVGFVPPCPCTVHRCIFPSDYHANDFLLPNRHPRWT